MATARDVMAFCIKNPIKSKTHAEECRHPTHRADMPSRKPTLYHYSGAKNKWHKILHKMGKSAVALWKPWIEKWFVPHLKAVNVSFNLKYQTLQKLQGN